MTLRHSLYASAAAFCIVAAQPAQAQRRAYDVPAQPVTQAIPELARQAGIQIVAPADGLEGVQSHAVRGMMDVRDALRRMVEGIGLTIASDQNGVILLRRTGPSSGEGEAEGAAANSDGAEQESVNAGATSEILVLGRRTMNVDVRRTENDVQPYVVFNAEEIQRSGASNLEDFFRSRLPMNAQRDTSSSLVNVTTATRGALDLRGLGINQTLVLVDGRRLPGKIDTGGGIAQADIVGIPISAVERVEVLPATASGIYGGGATGGVVNIILRRDYSGLDLTASYGDTFDFNRATASLAANGGFALEGGRTQITFGASWRREGQLLAEERNELARRSRELLLANNPAAATTPIAGYTPNVCSTATTTSTTCSSTFLVLDPAFGGSSLGSNRTFVPGGYRGFEGDGAAALRTNAGQYNVDAPPRSLPLLQALDSVALSINLRRRMTNSVDAFVDVYADRTDRTRLGGSERVINIPANSAFNPFQQNILVNVPGPTYSFMGRAQSDTLRFRGGLIVRLPGNWGATFEHSWSRNRASYGQSSAAGVTPPGLQILQAAALRDVNQFPISDPGSAFVQSIIEGDPAPLLATEWSLRFSGPLFTLPGGPLSVTGLLERRDGRLNTFFRQTTRTDTGVTSYFQWPELEQDVQSAYFEARLPLISERNRLTFINELELTAAARRDEYQSRVASTRGVTSRTELPPLNYTSSTIASTDFTVGVKFSPFQGLIIRGSYGTGFLPPALDQLVSSVVQESVTPSSGTDPLRGNGPLAPTGTLIPIQFGNPEIRPERSKSLSAGLIISPTFLSGMRLSVDYVRISKADEIVQPTTQFVIDNEALYPGRIRRGSRLPDDPAGWAGPITFIDSSILNLANTNVEAWDYQLEYTLDTDHYGHWLLYAVATHLTKRQNQAAPGRAPVSTLGFTNGPLEWRANIGIDWELGPWGAGWNAQYFDGYRVCTATATPTACATSELNQGTEFVPSQTYHDAYLRYRFTREGSSPSFLRGTEITLAVQNVFNERPPALASTTLSYSTYGDPRLRRFVITIRRSFGR